MVEAQEPTKTFAALNRSDVVGSAPRLEEAIAERLVVALLVIMRDVLVKKASQVALAEGKALMERIIAGEDVLRTSDTCGGRS
jgi:hypothetical protein